MSRTTPTGPAADMLRTARNVMPAGTERDKVDAYLAGEPEHSATPWVFSSHNEGSDILSNNGSYVATDISDGDADFIVTAVNNHGALVSIAKSFDAYLVAEGKQHMSHVYKIIQTLAKL